MESGRLDYKNLVNMLKRAKHSEFKDLLIHDNMMMNCYNVEIDSDVGFHYNLHVPFITEEDYAFYDTDIIININKLLEEAQHFSKELLEDRKKLGLKPKDADIIAIWEIESGTMTVTFKFRILEETKYTSKYETECPANGTNAIISNILTTYTNIINRIDLSAVSTTVNVMLSDILQRVEDSVRTYYLMVPVNGKNVRVPLMKSFFRGVSGSKFEKFYLNIAPTTINKVYLYTISFTLKDVTEQFVGYIQDY